jgi:hypothetical protein
MAFLEDVATWLDSNSTRLAKLSGTSGNLVKSVAGDAAGFPDTLVILYENMGQRPAHSFSTPTTPTTNSTDSAPPTCPPAVAHTPTTLPSPRSSHPSTLAVMRTSGP